VDEALTKAMWEGDLDRLHELAPCGCCCDEHTFGNCPARLWGGCRGQDSVDHDAWQKFYEQTCGMPYDTFYGVTEMG
jgi:hypothetical protein